jgi:hypothetical protein
MTRTEPPRNDRKRRVFRTVISLLLSFFLMLSILVLSLLLLMSFTILKPSFLLEQADKSNYTEAIRDELEETLISYGLSSGFDETFFLDLLNVDDMRADIFLEAEKMYDSGAPGANLEAFRADLCEKLTAYVEEHGEKVTPQIKEALDYLADLSTEAYRQKIEFPLTGTLSGGILTIKRIFRPALIAAAVFCAVVLAFLLGIHPRKKKALPYVIYAFTACGIFLGAAALAVMFSGRIDRVGITNKGLYYLITTYITDILNPMLWIAACMIALSAAAALLYIYSRRRKQALYRSV